MKYILICSICFVLNCQSFVYAENIAELREIGDKYWQSRDDQPKLLKCIEAYEKALNIVPTDELLLTRLSIAYYWKANNNPGRNNSKQRIQDYLKGVEYAEKLCKINPRSVSGNFWHATNNASYGNEKGYIKSALVVSDVKKRNKIVMEEDKYYYDGGPQRLAARVIWGTPGWFRGKGEKLEDGVNLIKDALSVHPNFTLSHIFIADLYWEMSKKQLAKSHLIKVFEIPENSLKEYAPENRRDKQTAKEKLKEYFGE